MFRLGSGGSEHALTQKRAEGVNKALYSRLLCCIKSSWEGEGSSWLSLALTERIKSSNVVQVQPP